MSNQLFSVCAIQIISDITTIGLVYIFVQYIRKLKLCLAHTEQVLYYCYSASTDTATWRRVRISTPASASTAAPNYLQPKLR